MMNPNADCNCCPASSCDACMPMCSTAPYVRARAERPIKHEFVCSKKNCEIFGGHDTNSLPELQCHQKRNKAKYEKEPPLGLPIGVVAANINLKAEGNPADIIRSSFSVYLKAFARLHLNDVETWDSLLIDDIINEGLKLLRISLKSKSSEELPSSDIYLKSEVDILREFDLAGFTFQVELMPRFKLNNSNANQIKEQTDDAELTLEQFMTALKRFFRDYKYCLLTVDSYYAMIWRSKEAYFVFDVCGRRLSDFKMDLDEGVVVLMCFKSLKNIEHLIINLGGFEKKDTLIVRELKLVKAVTPNGDIMQRYYGIRTHQYQIINDDYAFLRSELHLSLNKSEVVRNRSSLAVAVAAIVASKIDHPATWDTRMLNNLICFGVQFYQENVLHCKDADDFGVNEFPTCFPIGQFHVKIELHRCKYTGNWRCVPNFHGSELANIIQEAFDANQCKLILQINYQMYAIWKKHDFIYLLDPYRHRILGKPNESEVYEQMEKSATVRIFRTFQVFMTVFNNILQDSNRSSPFFVHIVKVRNIQTQKKHKNKCIDELKLNVNGEILSLNENICLEEAEDKCKATLGEISDFEDEDLKSDVVEIELQTSSSEEEVLDDEESVWEGEEEEIKDIETSSSGEEDGATNKANNNVRKNARTRTFKDKTAKKGDTKKYQRGKGANDREDNPADDTNPAKHKNDKKITQNNQKRYKKIKAADRKVLRDSEVSEEVNHVEKNLINDPKIDNSKDRYEKDIDTSKNRDTGEDQDLSKAKEARKDKAPSKQIDESNIEKENTNFIEFNKDEERHPPKNKVNEAKENSSKSKKDLSAITKLLDFDKVREAIPNKAENILRDKDFNKETVQNKAGDNKIEKVIKIVHDAKKIDTSKKRDSGEFQNFSKEKYADIERSANKFINESKNEKDNNAKNKEIEDINKSADDQKKSNLANKNLDKETDNSITEHNPNAKENNTYKKTKERSERSKTQPYTDGTEANDDNDCFIKEHACSFPNPNRYPGCYKYPMSMAVVGSESGSYISICSLFRAGFNAADRVFLITPWDMFVIFRCSGGNRNSKMKHYFLYDGCICNLERFQLFDLSVGTAGLLCFEHIHNVIEYIRNLRKTRKTPYYAVNNIYKEYSTKSYTICI